jgi:hypothetical protein
VSAIAGIRFQGLLCGANAALDPYLMPET